MAHPRVGLLVRVIFASAPGATLPLAMDAAHDEISVECHAGVLGVNRIRFPEFGTDRIDREEPGGTTLAEKDFSTDQVHIGGEGVTVITEAGNAARFDLSAENPAELSLVFLG